MASRPVRFPEIDDELRKIIDANMDEVPARKRAREAFKDIQLGIDHILFKVLFFEKQKKRNLSSFFQY
jgi:acylglycerol lipase